MPAPSRNSCCALLWNRTCDAQLQRKSTTNQPFKLSSRRSRSSSCCREVRSSLSHHWQFSKSRLIAKQHSLSTVTPHCTATRHEAARLDSYAMALAAVLVESQRTIASVQQRRQKRKQKVPYACLTTLVSLKVPPGRMLRFQVDSTVTPLAAACTDHCKIATKSDQKKT